MSPQNKNEQFVILFDTQVVEGKGNPYLALLYEALASQDIEVGWITGKKIPFWRAALKRNALPDIIHFQWQNQLFLGETFFETLFLTSQLFLQLITLRWLGVKFVWTVHNLVNHRHRQVQWELFASRWLARCVDVLLVHCESIRLKVSQTFRVPSEKIDVIHHGHYLDWYPSGLSRECARDELSLPLDKRIFLYFGHIQKYKGVDFLIKQFKQLSNENACLVIAGRPAYPGCADELAALAADDERILLRFRYLSDEDLVNYLKACDIVTLPYRDILTSGSVILAASYARPIIAPKIGCIRELPSEATILYIPAGDDNGLVEALRIASSYSDDKLVTMGQSVQKYVEKNTWKQAAQKIQKICLKILEK
jgi:glycosyltransferase involved in cell wall biosynthesis